MAKKQQIAVKMCKYPKEAMYDTTLMSLGSANYGHTINGGSWG